MKGSEITNLCTRRDKLREIINMIALEVALNGGKTVSQLYKEFKVELEEIKRRLENG